MSGSTISTTVTTGVTVGGAAYPSPLTIAATGVVAPSASSAIGVYAPAGQSGASLINQGSIFGGGGGFSGPGTGGVAVDFLTVATLTNTGTITGGAAGPYATP